MKSKVLKTYNLPPDAVLIGSIDAKPTFLFAIIFVIGLFLLTMDIPSAYSVSMILLSLVAIVYLPKVVMMEFYHDCPVCDRTESISVPAPGSARRRRFPYFLSDPGLSGKKRV